MDRLVQILNRARRGSAPQPLLDLESYDVVAAMRLLYARWCELHIDVQLDGSVVVADRSAYDRTHNEWRGRVGQTLVEALHRAIENDQTPEEE